MHARASAMSGDPALVDAAATMLEENLYSQLEQVDGFRGVVALAQRDSGNSLIVTFWDSKESMSASEDRANQMRSAAATQVGAAGIPQVDRYEVIFYKSREK